MKTFILIIMAYAGPLADTDSVSITTHEFNSAATCQAAGKAAAKLGFGTTKVVKFTCVVK